MYEKVWETVSKCGLGEFACDTVGCYRPLEDGFYREYRKFKDMKLEGFWRNVYG